MNELVTITGLSKTYGHFTALNNMNLVIPRGRIIGLLGPNGSGKTTLIKLLNGLLTPASGQILINGHTPGVETKAMISYLPERSYLTSNRRVEDLVEYFVDFYDNFNKEKALGMLESLHIDLHARLKTLSKGTKEKVQLILVMSRNAQLYLLDEPIAGVDPAARDYIMGTIINNYADDATVLISTHLIADIERVLDEVIFLKDGRIVRHETVDELKAQEGKSVDEVFREEFRMGEVR